MYLVTNRRALRKLELPGTGGISTVDSCRFFRDNERFVVMSTSTGASRKLYAWDRWRDALQVRAGAGLGCRGRA